MNRSIYFEKTLERCKEALAKNSNLFPLESVINQLEYLIKLEKGMTTDISKLDNIKIGWIAVREMDGYEDRDLIHSLCKISEEAEKMLLDRINPKQ